jgi:hypothetical protein
VAALVHDHQLTYKADFSSAFFLYPNQFSNPLEEIKKVQIISEWKVSASQLRPGYP